MEGWTGLNDGVRCLKKPHEALQSLLATTTYGRPCLGFTGCTPRDELVKPHGARPYGLRAQELCESRGGRPGLPSLISLRFLWT